jgi:aminopeptidase N
MMRHSAFHESTLAFGLASYAKPATVLIALREVLGEDVFYGAYRSFVDEWAFKHPYPWDLFNTFEAVAGQDLDWFWRSWYYETWTLDQAVAGVENARGRATVLIEDEGLAIMPVLLEVQLANGETIKRRLPVDVWLGGRRTAAVTLETGSSVVRVEIDPNRRFPDVDRSDNVWTRDGIR